MDKKKLTPKQQNPVTRKTSISLPELHEEQLTGGLGDQGAIAPAMGGVGVCYVVCYAMESCSYDGDDA